MDKSSGSARSGPFADVYKSFDNMRREDRMDHLVSIAIEKLEKANSVITETTIYKYIFDMGGPKQRAKEIVIHLKNCQQNVTSEVNYQLSLEKTRSNMVKLDAARVTIRRLQQTIRRQGTEKSTDDDDDEDANDDEDMSAEDAIKVAEDDVNEVDDVPDVTMTSSETWFDSVEDWASSAYVDEADISTESKDTPASTESSMSSTSSSSNIKI